MSMVFQSLFDVPPSFFVLRSSERGLTVFYFCFLFLSISLLLSFSSSHMTTKEASTETVHVEEPVPAPRERDEYGFYKGCDLDAISGGLAHSEIPESVRRRAEEEWARARDEYEHRGTCLLYTSDAADEL